MYNVWDTKIFLWCIMSPAPETESSVMVWISSRWQLVPSYSAMQRGSSISWPVTFHAGLWLEATAEPIHGYQ